MDTQTLAQNIGQEIRKTMLDIDEHLTMLDGVPMKCLRRDIDSKLSQMKVNIVTMILKQDGLPVEVVNGPQPTCGGPEWQGGYREPNDTEGFG